MNDTAKPTIQPDVLGEEQRIPAVPDLQDQVGTRRTGRDAATADEGDRDSGAARPGADENQAGFVKDPDKRFQP